MPSSVLKLVDLEPGWRRLGIMQRSGHLPGHRRRDELYSQLQAGQEPQNFRTAPQGRIRLDRPVTSIALRFSSRSTSP